MRTAASENVFMKLRKIYSSEVLTLKTQVFQHQYQKQVKIFISISRLVSHEVFNYILYFFGVGISLKRGRGIGNGEQGMRLTISDKILLSEGAEFIDHSRFLWLLIPPNVGTCHLSGHSFAWKAANASIFMKFRTMHKWRTMNSMLTIVFFCSFWRRTANVSTLMKFLLCTNRGWSIQWW